MHLISIDASPKQLSKIRNGHKVRIKHGSGVSVVVSPSTYNIVHRAFKKKKGADIQLSQEELYANKSLSPEQHSELSKQAEAGVFHPQTPSPIAGGSIFSRISKTLKHPAVKKITHAIIPELAGDIAGATATYLSGSPTAGMVARKGVKELTNYGMEKYGYGLRYGGGMIKDLKDQNLESAHAGAKTAQMSERGFAHKFHLQPVKTYWDEPGAPPSRGSGLGHKLHHRRLHDQNLIQGRGTLSSVEDVLPVAMRSQPYGTNFHMQFQLPPEYHRYNSGTE
jgi:hypothetical protein